MDSKIEINIYSYFLALRALILSSKKAFIYIENPDYLFL